MATNYTNFTKTFRLPVKRVKMALIGSQFIAEIHAESIKRVRTRKRDDDIDWAGEKSQSVYEIRDFIEFKTTWHPIGA